MRDINVYQGIILDLDGTVYRGDENITGAREAVLCLQKSGRQLVYLSNNASATRVQVIQKLVRQGFPVEGIPVITGTSLLASYMAKHAAGKSVLLIGEPGLAAEFALAGVSYTLAGNEDDFQPAQYGAVAIGCDHSFTYLKLNQAYQVLLHGAMLVTTDHDATYPVEDGSRPGTGAVLASIEAASGVKSTIAGKPSLFAAEQACAAVGLPPELCMVVGDRLDSDVALGQHLGASALVLSGVTSQHQAAKWHGIPPDAIFTSLASLADAMLVQQELNLVNE